MGGEDRQGNNNKQQAAEMLSHQKCLIQQYMGFQVHLTSTQITNELF